MLETVDLKARMKKKEYREAMERLDARLGVLQREVRAAGAPVLIVFDGWDAAGKGTVMSRLLQALDPRWYGVEHIQSPTPTEMLFPPMRRFWMKTPARGEIALFDHSWYRDLFEGRLEETPKGAALVEAFERARVFERQLADDGATIVKFFLHIDTGEQARRFKKLAEDPAFAWKVGKAERRRHKGYRQLAGFAEELLRETSTPSAPWTIVAAHDTRWATVRVAETLAAMLERAVSRLVPAVVRTARAARRTSPLDRANLKNVVSREKYEKLLPRLQGKLRRLQHVYYRERRSALIVYEGWDAAGKGGNIRRLVRELDPRGYDVAPFGAPQGEEKAHHYLWRFWRGLQKGGHWTIFDRSQYGRVLVERVEKFATREEWERAYREINEFERELTEAGVVVIKFWLHISKGEQLKRFRAREKNTNKQWKITAEDWRNRKKWDAYRDAVSDAIERTSTTHAPWTIIEANDKLHARVQALRTVIERTRAGLKRGVERG